MSRVTKFGYKSLKKIYKVKEDLLLNSNCMQQSILENKLFKLHKELAEEICNSAQYRIDNDGWEQDDVILEAIEFRNLVKYGRFNLSQRNSLDKLLNKHLSGLKYPKYKTVKNY